jgi:hypothetical protein
VRANGRVLARLCAPCRDGQTGRLLLSPPRAFAFFNGRTEASLGARHARIRLPPR